MNAVYFGQLVRAMRKERSYVDENGRKKSWTQEMLAQHTLPGRAFSNAATRGLTTRQIRDIEDGTVRVLRPSIHIEPLARAFHLSEAQKIEFYAAAGFIYLAAATDNTATTFDPAVMTTFLRQLPYPVGVFTPLGDILAFNAYFRAVYGYSTEALRALREDDIGANILRVYFEPIFHPKTVFGGARKWREQAERSVRAFRVLSLRYMTTKRYHQIVNYMQGFPEFVGFWELCEGDVLDEHNLMVSPFVQIYHPQWGELTFMKFNIPPLYLGHNLVIFGHFPIAESEPRYQTFKVSVRLNDVDTFSPSAA